MATEQKDLGAVAVAGTVKFEVVEHDADHVKLRNVLEADQYVVIDFEALRALASILNRAAGELDVHKQSGPDREFSGAPDLLI